MVRTPTTFIVGAGGSRPYGLPLGSGLLSEAQAVNRESDVYALLREIGIQPGELTDFLHRIRQHPSRSIDAFLEKHHTNESIMKVGRAMIAALMAQAIARLKKVKPAEDWLGEIIEHMGRGARDRAQFEDVNASVRFVTFNFDSIIEDRLERDAGNMFESRPGEAIRPITDVVKVVHVHGRLPPPPVVRNQAEGKIFLESRYGSIAPEWINWLKSAASNVNVVIDPIDDQPVVAKAREYIAAAKVVCFLGFSYHSDNLLRLEVRKTIKEAPDQDVFGSAKDEPEGRRDWIEARIPIRLSASGDDCLKTLTRFNVFVD